jgi:hypothetical protein
MENIEKTPKVCPIYRASTNGNLCVGKSCAWYVEEIRDCAIPIIAKLLYDIETNTDKIEANTSFLREEH